MPRSGWSNQGSWIEGSGGHVSLGEKSSDPGSLPNGLGSVIETGTRKLESCDLDGPVHGKSLT